MSHHNNVFYNINTIHALLTIVRAGGFTFSHSHEPEIRLRNQWKIVLLIIFKTLGLYIAFFVGFSVIDYGELTSYANLIVVCGLLFSVFTEPVLFWNRLKVWKMVNDLHECDLIVKISSLSLTLKAFLRNF